MRAISVTVIGLSLIRHSLRPMVVNWTQLLKRSVGRGPDC
jgi:hypothetical protein